PRHGGEPGRPGSDRSRSHGDALPASHGRSGPAPAAARNARARLPPIRRGTGVSPRRRAGGAAAPPGPAGIPPRPRRPRTCSARPRARPGGRGPRADRRARVSRAAASPAAELTMRPTLLAACGGFLLAVLWMDLMFDLQMLGAAPEAAVASIAAYYRRVTTDARPMNQPIGLALALPILR